MTTFEDTNERQSTILSAIQEQTRRKQEAELQLLREKNAQYETELGILKTSTKQQLENINTNFEKQQRNLTKLQKTSLEDIRSTRKMCNEEKEELKKQQKIELSQLSEKLKNDLKDKIRLHDKVIYERLERKNNEILKEKESELQKLRVEADQVIADCNATKTAKKEAENQLEIKERELVRLKLSLNQQTNLYNDCADDKNQCEKREEKNEKIIERNKNQFEKVGKRLQAARFQIRSLNGSLEEYKETLSSAEERLKQMHEQQIKWESGLSAQCAELRKPKKYIYTPTYISPDLTSGALNMQNVSAQILENRQRAVNLYNKRKMEQYKEQERLPSLFTSTLLYSKFGKRMRL